MANSMIAGVYKLWVAMRDSSGYPMGDAADPNNVANGTTLHAYVVEAPVEFQPPQATYDTAQSRGGQRNRAQRDMGVSDLGTATVTLDHFDEKFHAMITGGLVDTTTLTSLSITAPNTQKQKRPRFVVGLSVGATTEAGDDEFLTYILGNVVFRAPAAPGSTQGGGVNPNPLQYEMVIDLSPRTGLGRLFSSMALDTAADRDTMIMVRAPYMMTVTTYVGLNTDSGWTLGYLPTSSDATGAASNSITKNGALEAVTSVSTSTGAVAEASITDAAKYVVGYQTEYETA